MYNCNVMMMMMLLLLLCGVVVVVVDYFFWCFLECILKLVLFLFILSLFNNIIIVWRVVNLYFSKIPPLFSIFAPPFHKDVHYFANREYNQQPSPRLYSYSV